MTREELIAALERAEGPSRELDLRICRDVLDSEPLGHAAGMTDEMCLAQARWGPWPRYTAILDAALTLVPEGLSVLWFRTASASAACAVVDGKIGEAATPAIALCIATLKARA